MGNNQEILTKEWILGNNEIISNILRCDYGLVVRRMFSF